MSNGKTSSYLPVTTKALCSPLVLVFKLYFFFLFNQEKVNARVEDILLNTGLFHPKSS